MGHIRIGRLPKSRSWSGVFAMLGEAGLNPPKVANAVARATRYEISSLQGDPGINYCFWILVRVVSAARTDDFAEGLERLGIRTDSLTSGLTFVQRVAQKVEHELTGRGFRSVPVQLAELSLRQTLSTNIAAQTQSLFGTDLDDVRAACRRISTQKQFGRVARDFFSQFTSRFIRYVTDKELSNHIGPDKSVASPRQALEFQQALDRYCIEVSKIVEDFAAGWFSKHNWESNYAISEDAANSFTMYALEKIHMELQESR